MRRAAWVILVSSIILAGELGYTRWAAAQDGIPDNCEYTNGAYYQPNVFPRYEAHNQRLVLVDWGTGADVRVIESGLSVDPFWIIGWSPDCRYLVAALGGARDYAIWDTINGNRMNTFPHARRIDWSSNSQYAVVQGDSGANLWKVESNQTVLLTTVFDDVNNRNFNALTWSLNGDYLAARLPSGKSVRYDLSTGQELPIPISTYSGQPPASNLVTIGGQTYQCTMSNSYWYPSPTSIFLRYDRAGDRLVLEANYTTVQTIMEGVKTSRFENKGWSSNCHYLAFALGDDRLTDTYVWDVINNRLVDVFPGAQILTHRVYWDPTGDYMIIESRHGAYLWNLPANTRTLLHEGVTQDSSRWSSTQIHNFHQIVWDKPRGQILAVPAAASNTVVAYDMYTGQTLATYDLGGREGQVYFTQVEGIDWLILNSQTGAALWNR